jgi:hypothetical protein
VNDELALPDAPLPACLTEYEKPDWDALAQENFSTQRAKLCELARHSADAKMYIEGSIREIQEGAANASVLQTIAHVERLLGPLAIELSRAVEFVKEARETPDENWTPSRHSRQLLQVLKAEKGVRDLMGCARELMPKVAIENKAVIGTYNDLRGSKAQDKVIPADIVSDYEEKVN